MSSTSVIELIQLTKYYGRTIGIEHLNLTVATGEIFGFLGPNGAGKTTTIRLLLDLLRPTGGEILIFGRSNAKNSQYIRQKCGYLPGNFSAYGQMTGTEYLKFMANLRNNIPVLQSHLLDRFELSEKELSQKIKYLSHGTRQKLGIVQAFFHQPELIILDEPTTGLDPLMQEEFYDLVRETQSRGSTFFFSSHNLSEVEKICHRVAIIRNGKLIALETLDRLKKKRFRKLKIKLRQPVDNLRLEGAELVNRQGLQYDFLVQTDINVLLKSLIHLPLEDLVYTEPDLEEVFIALYRRDENGQA